MTYKDCLEYLRSQPVYTLYRPARRNYRRNKIKANFCGEVFQMDIMDMKRYGDANNGYLYSLLGYDTFSKYLTSTPMKNRKPASVITALTALVETLPFTILNIFWDKEGSFLSKVVQAWLKSHNIANYTTKSQTKAAGVERVIRTIRVPVQRHFTRTGTKRWLYFLPTFVNNYNNRKHSTTKLRPLDIVNDPLLVVPQAQTRRVSTKLPPIGSYVRLNRLRGLFEKEATGTWTTGIFRVTSHHSSQPIPTISVEDLLGEPVLGSFYPPEYQLVTWAEDKQVDQVYKSRKNRNIVEYLVSLVGYPERHREWIRT